VKTERVDWGSSRDYRPPLPGAVRCGRPCPGSIPVAGYLFRYVTNHPPKANWPIAFHPFGVSKWVSYHLRLGRQKQVWFIPLRINVECAGKIVLKSLENACHTWAPYVCSRQGAIQIFTFTFTYTLWSQLNVRLERAVSGRFSSLPAPFQLRDVPLRAPLPLHCFLPRPLHAPLCSIRFRPAPLRFQLRSHALLHAEHGGLIKK